MTRTFAGALVFVALGLMLSGHLLVGFICLGSAAALDILEYSDR
jgi:hypothetical protein